MIRKYIDGYLSFIKTPKLNLYLLENLNDTQILIVKKMILHSVPSPTNKVNTLYYYNTIVIV